MAACDATRVTVEGVLSFEGVQRERGVSVDEGEEQAFHEFVVAHSAALLKTAFLVTGDWGGAEDLLQTALLKTYRAWRRVRSGDPSPYVRRVMINAHLSSSRKRRVKEVPLAAAHEVRGPDDVADGNAVLASILAYLPPRQRAVVALRYCADLSEGEVASLLGCSVGTVKSQASRALSTLRELPQLRSLTDFTEEWA